MTITLNSVIIDIWVFIKLLVYLVYSWIENFLKLIIPSSRLYKNVNGDVVLITGAAGGIGQCLATKFFDLGCTVICIDYNQKELNKLRDFFTKEKLKLTDDNNNKNIILTKRLHFFTVDISSSDEVKSVARKIKLDVGNIDILINNAGIMNKGKFMTELNDQEIQNIFNVNILSQFWLIREFLPAMIKNNKGHICNVASVCGLMGGYKLTDYCSTKFAVVGMTESIRVELKSLKSRVQTTLVVPFHVKTKMFHGVQFERLSWVGLSMSRNFVAEEIVNGILLNKEFVAIPKVQTGLFYLINRLTPTKFSDKALEWLEINKAMDKYMKTN